MNPHHESPELWFRPGPNVPQHVLSGLVLEGGITATPRLGARGPDHEKGYARGQVVTLKVLDPEGQEQLVRRVRVDDVLVKPLAGLADQDLAQTVFYQRWPDVQEDLSSFERRAVGPDELVSIITFSYL